MTFKEGRADLFSAPEDYWLAHCISADFALGAGIAVQFNRRFNMRAKLNEQFSESDRKSLVGKALLIDRVFNLVTKQKCWQKPTYDTLRAALTDMCKQVQEQKIEKLAMPLIGCGLDRLEWLKVRSIIKEVFAETDVTIVICKI